MIDERRKRFKNKIMTLANFFRSYYHNNPEYLFSSPGRIEILGNHTDHNHGKVIVSTIDLSILALVRKTKNHYLTYKTDGYKEMKIDLNDLSVKPDEFNQSIGLIRGILFFIKQNNFHLGGLEIITTTNIFKGAGVSSSASFELLIGKIVSYCYNNDRISKLLLAKIAQKAEIIYFNKKCGLLDQMGISFGGVNYIDFRNCEKPLVKKMKFNLQNYDIILTYCLDSHSQLNKQYNSISEDMKKLASEFKMQYLRDVEENDFYQKKNQLITKYGLNTYLRGEHFFKENHRVDEFLDAIKNNDEKKIISLINESGESSFYNLKNCYINDINENLPQGILFSKRIINDGAVRVHGGGFAGTMIAFVNKNESKEYINQMQEKFGKKNVKRLSLTSSGARFIGKINDILAFR